MDGKVIRILSDTELVINLGAKDGVNYNDNFEIYEPGEKVIDPTTHKNLGVLDYVKAEVKVIELHPSFSLVSHQTTKTETVTHNALNVFAQSTRDRTTTVTHTLPVNRNQITPLKIKAKEIQIGDPIRSVD
ncbi:hypothetical protein ACFP1H_00050 [Secundilactobacillus hailunensis]|uniref:Uncharacterized protein n=1 Tax=Secundilactobacillus hailunensis TaxID=2559923 RepID=A0ABW1T4V5_9LACO|nr:hypothetical protein [Secundilactobacillus hailunensis]